jgi:hypothetical protein
MNRVASLAVAGLLVLPAGLKAQVPSPYNPMRSLKDPHIGGSSNIKVLGHLPLGYYRTTADIEMEQELSRPYVYMPRRDAIGATPRQRPGAPPSIGSNTIVDVEQYTTASKGVDIISIKDPSKPVLIYSWRIENQELHSPSGGLDNEYFKLKGRYYDAQSFQMGQSGPDADLGAVILDVTGLPDTSKVREAGRIRVPDKPGGFHDMFNYKHSDGRVLMFSTVVGCACAYVWDMEKFLGKDPKQGLIGEIPVPAEGATPTGARGGPQGYHDFYVAYDAATHQDKFYGAGGGGYYVFDISKVEEPKLITSVTGVAGVRFGHTFTPDPTGRYAVTEVEEQWTPLRIFDLKPGLDGTVKTISRPIGAWLASWDGNQHNHEVRWPYVFVSGYMDGLQVFNMMDPTNPYTVGYYYTCNCTLPPGARASGQNGGMDGAFGVDVRNADGAIVISDKETGLWVLHMDGFDGWNGHQWGMPNISSVQDWDNGPDGAPKQKVS